MLLLKCFAVVFVGQFLDVISVYNPNLTYNLRFNKLRFFPNVTGNYTIFQQKDKQYVSGYLRRTTTDEIDKIIVVFHRCNPEGLNCEYFQSWTLTDVCALLKDKHQIWSKWYGAFDPPIGCPVNQYGYEFRNATGEVNTFLKWYPDVLSYQWKITQKLYAGDFYVGSYVIEYSIFGYRRRNTKPKN